MPVNKTLDQVYQGGRDRVLPYSIVIRTWLSRVPRRDLEVILKAVTDFATEAEAEAARANIREDLRPYTTVSKFGGLPVSATTHIVGLNLDQYKQGPFALPGRGILMSRPEAEAFMSALQASMQACATNIKAARRKRSWRDSERAMFIADMTMRSERLQALRARIGAAFNMGGW